MSSAPAISAQPTPHAVVPRTGGTQAQAGADAKAPVFRLPAMSENLAHHKGRQVDVGKGFQTSNNGRMAQGKGGMQPADSRQQQTQQSAKPQVANGKSSSSQTPSGTRTQTGSGARLATAENVASKQNATLNRTSTSNARGVRTQNAQTPNGKGFTSNSATSGTNHAVKSHNTMVAPKTSLPKGPNPEPMTRANQDGSTASRGELTDDNKGRSGKQGRGTDEEQQMRVEQPVAKSAQFLNARFSQAPVQSSSSSNAAQVEIVSNVMSHMERMRQTGKGSMVFELPVADGKSVRVSMRMTGNRISVRFDTPSDKIYNSLHEGWADLAEQAATRGIKLDAPAFNRKQEEMEI